MTPRFSDDIEAYHRRVDIDEWNDVYVVGDVHGCLRELEALLDDLDPGADDLVVFVGDLVRKGPDNHGVVDLVRSADNMLSVRGNNEEKILRGNKDPDDLTEADKEWLASLPVAISWEGTLVTHAGVDPRKPLDEHTVDDLQNVRSMVPDASYQPPFWFDRYDGPDRVFFGHTVLEEPVVREYAVGLDTGCVYGGELTAYDWRRDELVTVDTDRTVEHRDPEKFIAPAPLA
ncbi:metallophosphoesterase family protein [Halobium salinum]|uniref:Metallophosphoesterase family protein n=1 Tax=Halobium salinum TaxID=1364940 RepID=A0ABD5P947_9EURY|nr:metallophosphoesterase family protein [Halobium salinum]